MLQSLIFLGPHDLERQLNARQTSANVAHRASLRNAIQEPPVLYDYRMLVRGHLTFETLLQGLKLKGDKVEALKTHIEAASVRLFSLCAIISDMPPSARLAPHPVRPRGQHSMSTVILLTCEWYIASVHCTSPVVGRRPYVSHLRRRLLSISLRYAYRQKGPRKSLLRQQLQSL